MACHQKQGLEFHSRAIAVAVGIQNSEVTPALATEATEKRTKQFYKPNVQLHILTGQPLISPRTHAHNII